MREILDKVDCSDFTRGDWVKLALAALDQADISPRELDKAVRFGKGRIDEILYELDLAEDQEDQSVKPGPIQNICPNCNLPIHGCCCGTD